jgi:signal transduction histidine kinase
MSVLGLLDLAKHENHSSSTSLDQYFSMMETSIHKLDETVKEILDYSRNARQNLTIESIDLKKMIDDHFEKMRFMPGSDLISRTVIVKQQYPFFSDQYRLSVIFNNLISNAIKYSDPSKEKPVIRIVADILRDKISLSFEDNGIGIEERYLTRVFDMFFRATEKNKGAGLGLYIVREAVDKLKGNVRIESVVGKGTTFRIELPNYVSNVSPLMPDRVAVSVE